MAEDFPQGPPSGWTLHHQLRRDGTAEKFYHNLESGQKFETEEELARFANYCSKTCPNLHDFKAAYMVNGCFVNRPWETDPDHTIKDYMEGRVGKLKNKFFSESSCITSNESATAIGGATEVEVEVEVVTTSDDMPAQQKKRKGKK
ncbi:hypothetical protein NMG60_11023485 [Bertholletia excelsa]